LEGELADFSNLSGLMIL